MTTKHEFFREFKSEKEPEKEVNIVVVFNKHYYLSGKMEEHLEREIHFLAAWVHRNLKEKEE